MFVARKRYYDSVTDEDWLSSASGVARSRTPSASSSVCEVPEVRLGERVLVVGQRTGVVRFYGKTNFAPGMLLSLFSFSFDANGITLLVISLRVGFESHKSAKLSNITQHKRHKMIRVLVSNLGL